MIMKGRLIVFTAGPRKIEDVSLLATTPSPIPPASFHLPVLVIATRRLQEFLRHMLAVIGLLSTSASHWAGRNSNFHTQMRRQSAPAKLFLPRCTLRNIPRGGFEGRVIKCYQENREGQWKESQKMCASPLWLFRSSVKWQQAALGCACLRCT